MGPDDQKLLQIIGAVRLRLGVIEINTNSKTVNSILNGFIGSVAQNSPTSQDSPVRGALLIMAYTGGIPFMS